MTTLINNIIANISTLGLEDASVRPHRFNAKGVAIKCRETDESALLDALVDIGLKPDAVISTGYYYASSAIFEDANAVLEALCATHVDAAIRWLDCVDDTTVDVAEKAVEASTRYDVELDEAAPLPAKTVEASNRWDLDY